MQQSTTKAVQGGFFGHPRGLSTLFFTEFWERFSYYGLRAILLLFMTSSATQSGLEFDTTTAGFIFGTYTSLAYLANLPGGWIADKLIGQSRAVLYGGILISLGNLLLAFHGLPFLFGGLLLVIFGTGLLKPNVSAMVGSLYSPDESARRDAGFSIFYVGINGGAFTAPLIVGFFGEKINWHWGFLASSIGMALGVVWYLLQSKYVAHVGEVSTASKETMPQNRRQFLIAIAGFFGAILALAIIHTSGIFVFTIDSVRTALNFAYLLIPVVFFANIFLGNKLTLVEKKRFVVIGIFFLMATIFWGSFEQAATTLTLFARDFTDRMIGSTEIPVSFFQSVNAMFIITLAPVFAVLWMKLGKKQPSSPAKLSLGLILVGAGFLVLATASSGATLQNKVTPLWLVVVYLLHTLGELCLSPVGLSNVTKLAPQRYVGQAMGIWFLGTSLGNYLAGQAAGFTQQFPMAQVFFLVFCIASGTGLAVMFVVKPIRNLMGGVE